ncbi:unnamed protein product [Amoebophrya sp. A25]|nr:unnamed protein product [Amoebophrya sp. A25]|eukprot:GSA25T00009106001.1
MVSLRRSRASRGSKALAALVAVMPGSAVMTRQSISSRSRGSLSTRALGSQRRGSLLRKGSRQNEDQDEEDEEEVVASDDVSLAEAERDQSESDNDEEDLADEDEERDDPALVEQSQDSAEDEDLDESADGSIGLVAMKSDPASTTCSGTPGTSEHTSCCLNQVNPLSASQKEYRVELKNFQNVQYYGKIGIGKSQNGSWSYFPAIYDTGSFEILVLSTKCEQCKSGGYDAVDMPLYDSNISDTFSLFDSEKQNTQAKTAMASCEKERKDDEVCEYRQIFAQHTFGSGPVESVKAWENVKIGSDSDAPELGYFPFWEITWHQIDAWAAGAKFSAIVGLGPRDYVPPMAEEASTASGDSAETENKTETLLERGDVNKFSICLERGSAEQQQIIEGPEADKMQWPSGWLTFNANTDSGETQVEVVGRVHWAVHMPKFGVNVGGNFTNLCGGDERGCGAIVDSGTSLLAAPTPVIEGLLAKVNIKEDCSNLDELPPLEFMFGNGTFTESFLLPPSAYVMRVEQTQQQMGVLEWFKAAAKGGLSQARKATSGKNATICVPAFMPLDKEDARLGPVFIMGMSFLRHYRTTYVRQQGSCPPKMYFDPVDPQCNKIAKSANRNEGGAQFMSLLGKSDSQPPLIDRSKLRLPKWAEKLEYL